jgi:hypothetical protein
MKLIVFGFFCFFLAGCEQFKGADGIPGAQGIQGQRGDTGKSGLISTKIYSGTPFANPFNVTCVELTGGNNQIVQVFMCPDSATKTALPFSNAGADHMYLINNTSVSFFTVGTNTTILTALYDPAWLQCSYRIEIRTFLTAAAKKQYLAQSRLDTSDYNTLLYGKEVN